MRRFFLSAAIMAIVAGGPLQAQGGDREIAQQIIDRLKVHRDEGTLKDFTLDLKVDQGVVLLRGSVQRSDQKADVLAAATGIDGITKVVDEIEVRFTATPIPMAEPSAILRPKATIADVAVAPALQASEAITPVQQASVPSLEPDRFSFKNALSAATPIEQKPRGTVAAIRQPAPNASPSATPGVALPAVSPATEFAADSRSGTVQRVTNTESGSAHDSDAEITASVVAALGAAQRQGRLKGFGVDVNTRDGKVMLNGRASSQEQRRLISNLVRQTPGVVDVLEDIAVIQSPIVHPEAGHDLQPLDMPSVSPQGQPGDAYAEQQARQGGTPAMVASSRGPGSTPVQTAPYRMDQAVSMNQAGVGMPVQTTPMQTTPMQGVPMQGGYAGMPVAMGPYAGVGAGPRYEQPYLPNYAWPGYAAYPNYAAVSYPQQYSPSAFPYIGPFYPYPQVPLGWRKVSLEWDDGWWFLDFTDR